MDIARLVQELIHGELFIFGLYYQGVSYLNIICHVIYFLHPVALITITLSFSVMYICLSHYKFATCSDLSGQTYAQHSHHLVVSSVVI